MMELPETIGDVEQLEELLSRPPEPVIEMMARLDGDLIVLGAGGKMGPTLARMARRASAAALGDRRIIAVSRFSDAAARQYLEECGVETICCDLLDRSQLGELPQARNVVYLTGQKFGSTGNEPLTWAMNVYLAGMVCERFYGCRIVAFSTGNVYGMVPVESDGSLETDPLRPFGDYAMSCLGRERIFSHFSRTRGIPVTLFRLNYANELRYGTLADIAVQVMADEPIDLTMGYFNAIWQGDANAMALLALEHADSPPWMVNAAGSEKLRVRDVAQQFGRLLNRPVRFTGSEAPDAFLSDPRLGHARLAQPTVDAERMIHWVADWLLSGGPTLGKATHFQTRDGKF